jgi:hypothetical protein
MRFSTSISVLRPLGGIRVAVPADGRDEALDLEPVRIGEKPHGRLVVVRFHLGGADVGEHHDAGLEGSLIRLALAGEKGRRHGGKKEK